MATLSRTYRPQTFADVIAQESVKETLRLEIQKKLIGHAYLFSGPRGIGKTTIARVFAKALNCMDPKEGEPCNACVACEEMNAGRSLDVIEMDAASHTGVDNVREAIVEHVRFAPSSRKYKVYILDEAHMLSTSAWNALLKTIEEPPAYAVFILVTTELHKVPATIQSRCQRFDFKRISDEGLASRVVALAEKEGAALDPEVVKAIVRRSDGCLRDAESLLGQLLVLGEKHLTLDIANLVLPMSRLPIAADLLATWSKRNLGEAFAQIEDLEAQGIPLHSLFDDLLQAIRLLLRAVESVEQRNMLANGDEAERKLATLVTSYEAPELADMALLLMERRKDAKQGIDARFCLELAASAVVLRLLPHAEKGTENEPPKSPPPTRPMTPAMNPPSAPEPNSSTEPAEYHPPLKDERKIVIPAQAGVYPVGRPEGVINHAPTESRNESSTRMGAPLPGDEPSAFTLGQVQGKWPAFLRLMDEKSKSLTFILKICRPVEVRGRTVTIQFQYPFHRDKIVNDVKNKRIVEECLREALGNADALVDGIIGEAQDGAQETHARDMVTNILKAFEGQIVDEAGSGTT